MLRSLISILLVLTLSAVDDVRAGSSPRESFRTPPPDARPWVYWVWMDGNLTREGITADLEAMHRAGIGGMIIMEVNVGIPQGPVGFMSLAWREHFVHAVREAERLGLEISLITGPGWTGSGGPWMTPEQSMQHIVARSTLVRGPRTYEDTLARPARRPAFFGDGLMPPAIEQAKDDYYRDIMVLAYPAPAREATVPGIDEKAFYTRAPYSSMTSVPSYFPSFAQYPAAAVDEVVDPARVIDLTERYTPGGELRWEVPAGDWTILRVGATSTGANTRPAPVPGVGLECDKLDTAALNTHFDAFFGTLIRDLGKRDRTVPGGWKMVHIDSWEMGAQNWTGAFRNEFRQRRGYDLQPYIPVITGAVVGSREVSERFLWDLRQTVQELVIQNHAGHLKTLGRRHGFGLSIEPYDMNPTSDMSLGSVADVPMCEFWLYGFHTSYSVIEATSIAHTTGRPVVGGEAFTSADTEHWDAFPGSMKALGDWALAAGVNRFVFHRYQHQPWTDLRPGMTMGPYGVHWERTQTWWDMVGGYHSYLARAQHLLRQGLPVADVCYLVAEGAPQVFQAPRSAVQGDPPERRGYRFDACAPDVFLARAGVEDGMIVFPDGMRYRVLVLPDKETMTLPMLKKIRRIVQDGATVIGPPPITAPGLTGYPACDAEIAAIAREVWGACDGLSRTENRFGKGRVVWVRDADDDRRGTLREMPAYEPARLMRLEASSTAMHAGVPRERHPSDGPGEREAEQYGDFSVVERTLRNMGVPVDFSSDVRLRFDHRQAGAADIYFLANPADSVVAASCTFRVTGKQPELWDPVTGRMRVLEEFRQEGGVTTVPLAFEPLQSVFIVFEERAVGGRARSRNVRHLRPVHEITGPWEVTFDSSWVGPGRVQFPVLMDWTRHPQDSVRYFSGIARYSITFTIPEGAVRKIMAGKRAGVSLDLGRIHDMARVRLNGRDLGVLWTAPWRVDAGDALRSRNNVLEVDVANRWRNRLVGDERMPPDADYGTDGNILRWPPWISEGAARPRNGRAAFATWKHFTADTPLLPSGLLGPVRVLVQEP